MEGFSVEFVRPCGIQSARKRLAPFLPERSSPAEAHKLAVNAKISL